jgi:hypothetical protein
MVDLSLYAAFLSVVYGRVGLSSLWIYNAFTYMLPLLKAEEDYIC